MSKFGLSLASEAADLIRKLSGVAEHSISLTLGSGWAGASELLGEEVFEIEAAKIPGFTPNSLPGHRGTISSVKMPNGQFALVTGARTHLYEDKGVQAVVHSVRTAAASGAKVMILTNGAGGIKDAWSPGQPVLISDHINLTANSPLEGATFIDLTDLYSRRLRDLAKKVDPTLDEGVYVQFRGPHYETPAEVQMAKAIGGHIVGRYVHRSRGHCCEGSWNGGVGALSHHQPRRGYFLSPVEPPRSGRLRQSR